MDWSSPRHTQHLANFQSVAAYFSQQQPSPDFHSLKPPAQKQPAPDVHSHKPPASPPVMKLSISASVVTTFGDTAVVVGSVAQLGGWDPSRGLRLSTDADSYPTWTGHVAIDCGGECEFKLVILRADGGVEWEPLEHNRKVKLSSGASRYALKWADPSAAQQVVHTSDPLVAATPSTASVVPSIGTLVGAPATPPKKLPVGSHQQHLRRPPPVAAAAAAQQSLAQAQPPQRPAFYTQPRANASFTVTTAAAPSPPPAALFDRERAEALLRSGSAMQPPPPPPPSFQAAPPPPVPPPPAVARVGPGGLETIFSQDLSWPPSLSPSVANSQDASSRPPSLPTSQAGSQRGSQKSIAED